MAVNVEFRKPGPKVIFFMLNSTKHSIYSNYKPEKMTTDMPLFTCRIILQVNVDISVGIFFSE